MCPFRGCACWSFSEPDGNFLHRRRHPRQLGILRWATLKINFAIKINIVRGNSNVRLGPGRTTTMRFVGSYQCARSQTAALTFSTASGKGRSDQSWPSWSRFVSRVWLPSTAAMHERRRHILVEAIEVVVGGQRRTATTPNGKQGHVRVLRQANKERDIYVHLQSAMQADYQKVMQAKY